MTSRSASGEGESLKAAMIHCLFGMTTSRARIAAPPSQFTTMRIRSTTCAIGSAADDESGLDMIHHLLCIEYQYTIYRQSSSRVLAIDKGTTSSIIKSVILFAAGLCEIGGGYLVWLWLRSNR